MKTLTTLASALTAAALFAGALAALGVLCVLGVGMAAAACDPQPPANMALSVETIESEDIPSPRYRPSEVSPDLFAAALASDSDFRTVTLSTPGSVPVL